MKISRPENIKILFIVARKCKKKINPELNLVHNYKELGRKRPSFRRGVVAQTSLPFHPSL